MKVKNQHGDLLLVSASIPKKAKLVKAEDGFIVEQGEGVHAHILESVADVEIYSDDDGTLYLKVNAPTKLLHEEHGCQVLTPGIYKKDIEREWDYELKEARKTMD
jgi:hypothetical protein